MTVKEVTDWSAVYVNSEDSGGWGYLSRIIIRTLLDEAGDVGGKKVVEVGSGSGRNSLELKKRGGCVTLLDLSAAALERARETFSREKLRVDAVNASLFAMPFAERTFDVVWNAGVIEHWTGEEQVSALREMIRICRREGIVITLNPYSGSRLHVAGKWAMKRVGKYPFMDAVNVTTLEIQARRAGGQLAEREYSIGFFVLFVGGLLQLSLTVPKAKPFLMPLFRLLNAFFCWIDRGPLGSLFYRWDRLLARALGGYLVVSVISKAGVPLR